MDEQVGGTDTDTDALVDVFDEEIRDMTGSGDAAQGDDMQLETSAHEGMVDVLQELAGLLLDDMQMDEAVTRVLDVAMRTLGSDDHAVSLTVSETGDPQRSFSTRDATSAWARELDGWQYENGEGPCLMADETAETCVVLDTSTDERFPRFCAKALEFGVRSCVSHPMLVDGFSLGSINVFHRQVDVPSEELVDAGDQLARASAPLLANWMAHRRMARLADQLEEALAGRAVIERAKGVLMAELGVDEGQAFELLRKQSNHEHRKLRDVAETLLAARRVDGRSGTRTG